MMPFFQSNNGYNGMMGGGMMSGNFEQNSSQMSVQNPNQYNKGSGMMSNMGGMMGGMGMIGDSEQNWSMSCLNSYSEENDLIQSGENQVIIANYQFIPQNITVEAGTTVTWINMDMVGHNIESGSHENQEDENTHEEFESPILGHMQSFSYTFSEPGEYIYHCDPHPYMEGTIIVV
jgi:amicyanin